MMKHTTGKQKAGLAVFLVYLLFLVYFLFFSDYLGRGNTDTHYSYNLEPFKEIRRFIIYWKVVGLHYFLLNIVGNIAGFMPFGFFLPVFSRRSRRFFNTVLLSALFSLCVETLQLGFQVGSFDVDDLILNTLGAILGYLLYKTVQKIRVRRRGCE